MTAETSPDDTRETVVVLGIRDPRALLAGSELFQGLPEDVIAATAAELEWMSLPGGARLYGQGDEPDAAYLVLSGRLAALGEDGRPTRRIEAGSTVGAMALITGSRRRESVKALRDSDLVRIPGSAFSRAFLENRHGLLRIARLAVERLEGGTSAPRAEPAPRTFTLLPACEGVDVAAFAAVLVDALGRYGRAELVRSAHGREHSSQWFHNIESRNDFVVYAGEAGDRAWTRLCVRQADSVLLLSRSDAEPARDLPALDAAQPETPVETVVLHGGGFKRGSAAACLSLRPHSPVHHVSRRRDVRRIARLLTGRAVGLVLSGGGARGFAHIGAVRALREAGVMIDLAGGTSMGALLAAGVALDWSYEEMRERFRRSFVETNPLADFTLPVISLVSGGRVLRLLQREFGSIDIEDLRLPYFCVSTDLTTGHMAVHREGPLWRWLRASIAIPGVLPPVVQDGHVYVDGGAINNLPVDVMRSLGRGPVIGIDAGADEAFTFREEGVEAPRPWELGRWLAPRSTRPGILQILWRAGMINSSAATLVQREQSDLLLHPPVDSLDLLDWKSFDVAIELGYRHALESLESAPSHLFERAASAARNPSTNGRTRSRMSPSASGSR